MPHPNFVILYVINPQASAAFYARLLGAEPVESSPTFAMFALDSGVMLGLWARHTVEPAAPTSGASAELAFALDSNAAVDAMHAVWRDGGVPIIQGLTAMDFGYTFTATDPDGHRLRVFAPGAA